MPTHDQTEVAVSPVPFTATGSHASTKAQEITTQLMDASTTLGILEDELHAYSKWAYDSGNETVSDSDHRTVDEVITKLIAMIEKRDSILHELKQQKRSRYVKIYPIAFGTYVEASNNRYTDLLSKGLSESDPKVIAAHQDKQRSLDQCAHYSKVLEGILHNVCATQANQLIANYQAQHGSTLSTQARDQHWREYYRDSLDTTNEFYAFSTTPLTRSPCIELNGDSGEEWMISAENEVNRLTSAIEEEYALIRYYAESLSNVSHHLFKRIYILRYSVILIINDCLASSTLKKDDNIMSQQQEISKRLEQLLEFDCDVEPEDIDFRPNSTEALEADYLIQLKRARLMLANERQKLDEGCYEINMAEVLELLCLSRQHLASVQHCFAIEPEAEALPPCFGSPISLWRRPSTPPTPVVSDERRLSSSLSGRSTALQRRNSL